MPHPHPKYRLDIFPSSYARPQSRSAAQRPKRKKGRSSPANTLIGPCDVRPVSRIEIYKVNHDLVGPYTTDESFLVDFRGNNHHCAVIYYFFEVRREQRPDMRDHFFDVLPIGSGKPS